MQSQPAPIERAYPDSTNSNKALDPDGHVTMSQPAQGVYLRVGKHSVVQEVSATAQRVELRVERGLANVNVHDPAHDSLILVDLPGGQAQLLKNGLYTFNADTNTVRVLKGEAYAFPGTTAAAANGKRIKVKEDHAVDFVGTNIRSTKFEPYEARNDLIPSPYSNARNSDGGYGDGGYGAYGGYGYSPYAYGFGYGAPYYAFGYRYPYGYGWGYPYDYGFWGYPYGYGLGFGYYGGYHGYHGYGGFHGGRNFHGPNGYLGSHTGGGHPVGGFHGGSGGSFHGGGGSFHGGGGSFHGGGGGSSHGGGGGHR